MSDEIASVTNERSTINVFSFSSVADHDRDQLLSSTHSNAGGEIFEELKPALSHLNKKIEETIEKRLKSATCHNNEDDEFLGAVKELQQILTDWKKKFKNIIHKQSSSERTSSSHDATNRDTKIEAVGKLENHPPPILFRRPPSAKRDNRRFAGTPIFPGDTIIELDGRLEDFPPLPPPSPPLDSNPFHIHAYSKYAPGPLKLWIGNPVGDYDDDEIQCMMSNVTSVAAGEPVMQPDGRQEDRTFPLNSLPLPSHPEPDPELKAETSKILPYVSVPISYEPYGHLSIRRYPDYMVSGIEAALQRFNERNPGFDFKLFSIEESIEFPKRDDERFDCSHHTNFWAQSCLDPSAKVLFFAEGHFISCPRKYSMTACCPVDPFKAGTEISNCQCCRRWIRAIRRGYPKHPDDGFYGAIGSQS